MKTGMTAIRDHLEEDGIPRDKVQKGDIYEGFTALAFSAKEKGGTRGTLVTEDGEFVPVENKTTVLNLKKKLTEDSRLVVETFRTGAGAFRTALVYDGSAILKAITDTEAAEDDD